jgi:hypothetical protein
MGINSHLNITSELCDTSSESAAITQQTQERSRQPPATGVSDNVRAGGCKAGVASAVHGVQHFLIEG